MSIANYTDLQTSVTNWLSRTNDTALIALYPDFVTLAEAKLNRVLRARNMEASATVAPSNGVVALPSDYLEIRRLYIDSSSKKELEYLTPETFHLTFPSSTGSSKYYTIEGSNILLADQSTSTNVKILYYQSIPDLATNSTNWLLTKHPDLYLAAVLSEAYDVIKNDAQAQKWAQKATMLAEQVISADKGSKYSGSAMRMIAA